MTPIDNIKIIEKLEAEIAALKMQNQWLSVAINDCPEAILITDKEGKIDSVNPAFTTITGYTHRDIIGKKPSILKSDIHGDALYADLWATVLAGHRWEGEICNKRKDGSLYWEKNSIAPIKNEQGEITHFVSTKVDISHFKEKESSQLELLYWKRKVLETLPAGVAIESNGKIIWVNKTLSEITGIEEQEILNHPIESMFPSLKKDERLSLRAREEQSKGRIFDIDLRLRPVGKRKIWCNLKAQSFSYSNGNMEFIWLFQDISLYKTAEKKLRENEELFRNAFSSNASLMFIASYPAGKIEEINPSFEKRTGFAKEEVLGRTSDTIHLWKSKTKERIYTLLAEKGSVTDLDTYYFTKEGTRRNCLINVALIESTKGSSTFITLTDTTTSKQALRSLKENEERFRFMAEGINDIISLHSPTLDLTIQYISPVVKQILGITSSKLIGLSPRELIAPINSLNEIDSAISRILGKESMREIVQYKFDSIYKETWIETSMKPMMGSDGSIIRIAAVSRDITHRKKIEQQLLEVSEMKDKFLSIIAHDLKNPFNTLLGFSSLLKDNADHYSLKRIKDFAGDIYNAARGGVTLLDELLEWALLQSGRLTSFPTKFNLYDNSKDVFELVNIQAVSKHIILINSIPPDIMVYADKRMDSTVLRNLISNALKFTPSGGIVRVSVKQIQNFVEVSVSDTGEGIPEQDIQKLFRIDVKPSEIGVSSEQKGSGLGLILCQEFVKKNGGIISAKSVFGQGSEFTYTIPAPLSDIATM